MSKFRKMPNGNWYFTADPHWEHANCIRFCGRPFPDVRTMNVTQIDNINSRVGENDHLVMAGDMTWGNPADVLDRINCKNIYFALGSHDPAITMHRKRFRMVEETLYLVINDQPIVVSHTPYLCWEKSHYGSWNLFGHIHSGKSPKGCEGEWDDETQLPSMSLFDQVIAQGKMMDIGVDGHDFFPWSFAEIKIIMDMKSGFLLRK